MNLCAKNFKTLIYKLLLLSTTSIALQPLASCKSCQEPEPQLPTPSQAKEMLIRINKTLTHDDSKTIDRYIRSHSLDSMEVSPTGLFYHIWGKPNGKQVETGDQVAIGYKLSLLDSTTCYSSEKDGPKCFKVGQGGVETGLEEGILLMKQGQNAKFIIPPHLAHGLVGDGKRIPARAIVVYDIELLQVKAQNNLTEK